MTALNNSDLFGITASEPTVRVNVYADEIQNKMCHHTGSEWHYIGLIVEDLAHPLLDDILKERYCGVPDELSPFYEKNNGIVHWSKLHSANHKNICSRWFQYILDPKRSGKTFYSYILGINNTTLNHDEFGKADQFNSKYNRFFRTAILYALKSFFPNQKIIIEHIYHETGQQEHNEYFPWHCIFRLKEEKNLIFKCREIEFLPKDHKKCLQSNLIQLCDCILGVSSCILHGLEKSNSSHYREELARIYLPLFKRMIENPRNHKSQFQHSNRMMIRFFPKSKNSVDDPKRFSDQFYAKRTLYFEEQISGQLSFL